MHLSTFTRHAGIQMVTWCHQLKKSSDLKDVVSTVTSLTETRFILLTLFHKTQFWLHASGSIDKQAGRQLVTWCNQIKKSSDLKDLVSMGTNLTETRFILLTFNHTTQFWLDASR